LPEFFVVSSANKSSAQINRRNKRVILVKLLLTRIIKGILFLARMVLQIHAAEAKSSCREVGD
jgi:hypothetical protein